MKHVVQAALVVALPLPAALVLPCQQIGAWQTGTMTLYVLSNGMRETISRMEVPSKSKAEHFMDMGGSDKVDQPIAMPEADKWVSKMTLLGL